MQPEVTPFFHRPTNTYCYVVADAAARRAAVVDPVLDYDAASGRTATGAADAVLAFLAERGYALDWILETHAHADHLSAAQHCKAQAGGRVAIGAGIVEVQATFKRLLNLGPEFAADGSQFDRLLRDGETFALGGIEARVIATPGHTPDGVTYLIGAAAFVGDTLFMPDAGTARCDFPGGSARRLYASIQSIYSLPPATRLFMCHDYGPGGRAFEHATSVAAERGANIHVRDGVTADEFAALREARDATLGMPGLLWPAIQVNIRAGHLPPAESNGTAYLRIPLSGA